MARYKDIDAIIEQMNGSTAETWGKGLGRSWWSHSVMLKDNIVQLMKDAPEADVVEVRHGKWLLDGRCSECLENPLTTHRTYCPSCGAKMDKNELLENPEQLDLRPISCGAKMDKGVIFYEM